MPRPIALLLGTFAAILLTLLLASAVTQALDPYHTDPAELARRYAEAARIEREAAQAEALAPLDLALGAAWRVLPLVATAGLVAYLGALGAAHVIRFRRERQPDQRGLLPVEVGQLPLLSGQALGAFHAARQLEAGRALVPHTLTYAPHHAPRLDYRADSGRAALLPADAHAAELSATPSFAALLDSGRIGRGNPMLLGFDAATGDPIEGSWLDLYSCGLGGLSGSGKSWTAAYLVAQAVLFQTRIVLLDPHAGNAESLTQRLAPLSRRFLCAPAESPREMRAAVDLVAAELAQRKAGKRADPLLFVADEYSALQRGELAEPLGQLVEALGQEGRKLGLFALVAGQIWTASRAGGTEVRDSLASAYVHRCRPAQARYLTGLTAADLPGDLLELPSGTAYMLSTAGDMRKVVIPRMSPTDLARVAQLVEGGTAEEAAQARPIGFHPPPAEGDAAPCRPGDGPAQASASGRAKPRDAEAARLLARFAAGATVHDLAAELAGTANPGDRRYKTARERVEALLRELAEEAANA